MLFCQRSVPLHGTWCAHVFLCPGVVGSYRVGVCVSVLTPKPKDMTGNTSTFDNEGRHSEMDFGHRVGEGPPQLGLSPMLLHAPRWPRCEPKAASTSLRTGRESSSTSHHSSGHVWWVMREANLPPRERRQHTHRRTDFGKVLLLLSHSVMNFIGIAAVTPRRDTKVSMRCIPSKNMGMISGLRRHHYDAECMLKHTRHEKSLNAHFYPRSAAPLPQFDNFSFTPCRF